MEYSKNQISKCKPKRRKKLKKRRNFQILIDPERGLEIKYCYKIGDIHIFDKIPENDFTSLISGLKDIKKVVSFSHDKEFGFITCNLLDNQMHRPPIKLLIDRLKSLGDLNAYNLSKTLDELLHFKNKEKKQFKKRKEIENIFEKPSYQDYLERIEKVLKQFVQKFPLIFWRDSNFEDQSEFQLIQMGFNHCLIESIGYDPQIFGLRLLKKGLPDLLWIKHDYYKLMNQLIKTMFLSNKDEGFPEFFLKTETNYIATKHKDYYVDKFEEEGFVEISVIEILDINEKDAKLIKPEVTDFVEKKDNTQSNSIEKYHNHHLLIDNDNFKQDSIKWIKKCYPHCKFTFLENDEEEKNRRCGFKKINQ